MRIIDKATIATIDINEKTGRYKLTMYKNCKPIFEKEYRTFTIAKIQQTKYQKKFNL